MDIALVTHYPHTHHKNHLMSATAKLKVEVSALHAGQNGHLEISCQATIPAFPMHHEQFADIKKKMVSGKFLHDRKILPSFRVTLKVLSMHDAEFSKINKSDPTEIELFRIISLRNAHFRCVASPGTFYLSIIVFAFCKP